MAGKMPVSILGSGNIGMDLLYKLKNSRLLEVAQFIGRNIESENLLRAKSMGFNTCPDSIKAIVDNPYASDIVFDATTADNHKLVAPVLKKLGKFVIDLTPSRVGKMCVPCLNGDECLEEDNINMVTCGGQSIVPLAAAVAKACGDTIYIESNSVIASRSAGPGTRANIDEYVQTTSEAIRIFANVNKAKSMIVLNPMEPPIIMRNTVYIETHNPDLGIAERASREMEDVIKHYVPGFEIVVSPTLYDKNIITISAQVIGSGDFLPAYAGNLDIITCAAVEMAERYAKKNLLREGACLL